MSKKYIVWFDEVRKEDISSVGGKGANLGEMAAAGIPVPFGFIVTSVAYFDFLQETKLKTKIEVLIKLLDSQDPASLHETAKSIQREIKKAAIPQKIARQIMFSYLDLSKRAKKSQSLYERLSSMLKYPLVAVRSSATAEDLPEASFAGQQETFLNIAGEANVVLKVREAWASLFTERAIFYREQHNFDHLSVGIAVPVQLMVSSDSSGVMFTVDPLRNDKRKIIIEAIYGLGELIVQGAVTPDHYEVDKKNLTIMTKTIRQQTKKLVKRGHKNKQVTMSKKEGEKQKIADEKIIELAKIGVKLEKHYYFPQDIEWAIEKDKIFIVQTRPITTFFSDKTSKREKADKKKALAKLEEILSGDPASPGIACGPAKIITQASHIDKVASGDVLVTKQTSPDFVPAMRRAVAIVTEHGGRTSHAAIVSRELGIPAVVGALQATKILLTGTVITVDGAKGKIYKGAYAQIPNSKFQIPNKGVRDKTILKTATKIYVNLAAPDRAQEVGKMHVDGVGLLRAEFMVANIGIHPKKLIAEKREKLFISKLSADLITFCHAFNPRPVVYRATDFKTNEYRNLAGGKDYEPSEENPMLGFRGAARYIADPQVFQLELAAVKQIRNKHNYKNLWLMIPFVRTVEELIQVKKIISTSGLFRSSSFKLWMMVEVPSNVILLDRFCQVGIDGVSIGSNDLTQLVLGVDRDSTELADKFDERNEAVLWAIRQVIEVSHKHKVTSSICGQAPSDYPELVEKLVRWGITSISVNPDVVYQVRENVYELEQKMGRKK